MNLNSMMNLKSVIVQLHDSSEGPRDTMDATGGERDVENPTVVRWSDMQ